MIAFGTLGLRYTLFANAARVAASAGAQCSTFQTDSNPPAALSAVTTANTIANQAVNDFTYIKLTNITCYIVTTPLSGGASSRQTTTLAKPADTNTNAYNFEVVLQGQISPLLPAASNQFLNLPGISVPISTQARSDVFFENTQGLTQ
jgi:hypothetical protein